MVSEMEDYLELIKRTNLIPRLRDEMERLVGLSPSDFLGEFERFTLRMFPLQNEMETLRSLLSV
jgi:hypothetical protein